MSTIAAIETQADLLINGAPPPNTHFLRPQVLPRMPFELKYEERRNLSADPRVRKQLADEAQFDGTVVAAVWREFAKHALTLSERWMTPVEFERMLLAFGITSPRLRGKVCDVFTATSATVVDDSRAGGGAAPPPQRRWNAVVVCKQILMMLTDKRWHHQDEIIRACFDRFDRPDPQGSVLPKQVVLLTELSPADEPPQTFRWIEGVPMPPGAKDFARSGGSLSSKALSSNPKVAKQMKEYLEAQRKIVEAQSTFVLPDIPVPARRRRRRGRRAPQHPTAMRAGATLPQLEPLKAMLLAGEIGNEFLPHITFDDFKRAFLKPENCDWVASFIGVIFEAIATFCSPPTGLAPLPPLQWSLDTLQVVPHAQLMSDADILLLTQLEQRGGSATDPVEKKPRRRRSTTPRAGGGARASALTPRGGVSGRRRGAAGSSSNNNGGTGSFASSGLGISSGTLSAGSSTFLTSANPEDMAAAAAQAENDQQQHQLVASTSSTAGQRSTTVTFA